MVKIKENGSQAQVKVLTVEALLDKLGGFSWFQLWAAVVTISPEISAAMISISPVLTGSDQFCNNNSANSYYTVEACEKSSSFPGVLKSFIQEWDLTGNRAWINDLFTSFQMLGALFGALVAGQCAERFGRKNTHFTLCGIMGIFGFASGWAPDPITFCIFRLFAGFAVGGCYVVYLNYLMEFLTPSFRILCGCVSLWAVGEMLLALVGYLLPGWRQLLWVTALPVFLIFLTFPWMPESPRWLLCQGRTDEAMKVFQQIARWNGRPPPDPLDILCLQKSFLLQRETNEQTCVGDVKDDKGGNPSSATIVSYASTLEDKTEESKDVQNCDEFNNFPAAEFASPKRKLSKDLPICSSFQIFRNSEYRFQLLVLMFAWFASQLIYYGISYNMKNLCGNPYLNVFYMGAVSLPGSFTGLLFNNRLGRRTTIIGFSAISCCLLLVLITVEEIKMTVKYPYLAVGLSLVIRLFISASFAVLSCFTAESFPTVVRVSCMGICALFGNIGGILAPQFVFISTIIHSAQYITFGLLSMATMVGAFSLREMTGKPLEDFLQMKPRATNVTTEEVEVDKQQKNEFERKPSGGVQVI